MPFDWNEITRSHANASTLADDLAAARTGRVMADLQHWGLIALTGEDAHSFLHGQVTNDLRKLNPQQAVFAAYCSAKGRMLANFLVLQRSDAILLMLPEAVRESIQKRLAMYVLRSKVNIRNVGNEWVRIGLSGSEVDVLLAEALDAPIGTGILSVTQTDAALAIRLGATRFDVLIEPEQAPALLSRLAADAMAVRPAAWDWLMVDAGVPSIVPETQDQFVPQMANMIELDGVSFDKGCYPGQEIVARSQYLGKQKRRLYLAHAEAEAQPGTPVYNSSSSEQAVGMVANAATAPGGGTDLLVVMQISAFEVGETRLGSLNGAALAFRPLAYMP